MQFVRVASSLPATQDDGPIRTGQSGLPSLILKRYFSSLAVGLCKWSAIVGSLREHIRIQFSTEGVDLGPALMLQGGKISFQY